MKPDRFVLRTVVVILCLFFIIILLNLYLDKEKDKFIPRDLPDTPTQMFISLLGELRYTFAAMLWMKIDHYHHEYERHLDPNHNPPLLQLTRIVTLLDPHFEDAYSVAAYDLGINFNKEKEALNSINEGIRNNPKSRLLHWGKGFLLFHFKHYSEAIPSLLTAYQESKEEVDKVNCERLLAHSYIKTGDYDKAVIFLKKILQTRSNELWAKKKLNEISK